MAETIKVDTPLTRQAAKYEATISNLKEEIAELKLSESKLEGVNQLLKFELLGLENVVREMQNNLNSVLEHVMALKQGLPE